MAGASDYIIDNADKSAVNVASQPTVLRGSALQNKQVFDKYSDLIVTRFNLLCNYVDENTSVLIDHSVLVLYASLGWVAD